MPKRQKNGNAKSNDRETDEDEDIMRLFSFPEEHHELVKRLHFVDAGGLSPVEIHKTYQITGLNYYYQLNVMPPRDFQRLILWAMLSVNLENDAILDYVSDKI